MLAGIILNLVTLLFMMGIIAVGPYIKHVTNNYFFWVGLGLILFIYLVVCRFSQGWVDYLRDPHPDAIEISRAFLLDMCPFTALAICFCAMIDPTRKLIKLLAPFAIFGGWITIVVLFQDYNEPAQLTWKYIFVGTALNPMYFMMHFINIQMGTLAIVCSPRITKNDLIDCHIFALIYFLYLFIFAFGIGVNQNITGVSNYDWTYGEYQGVREALGLGAEKWYFAAILGYMGAYVGIFIVIILGSLLQKIKHYHFYNQPQKTLVEKIKYGHYDLTLKNDRPLSSHWLIKCLYYLFNKK